ncbi:MAG: 16S rRNA processing protein RimM [Bacteroidetes bacterium]|nr:MAG: 16S rRNA processing protein RimM [Bacteroidota bacterium]
MNHYFKIGKLVSSFGLQGEIVLQHSLGKKSALKGLEAIFIEEHRDSFLPYFIKSAKIKSENETYLQIEGIDSREDAKKLVSKQVWITEADFKKFAGKSAPISLLGFHMIHEGEDLGEIIEVIEQPHQVLCKININNKEALIPVHEETLDKIDQKNRRVLVSLPDGLLDLYR